MHQDSKSGNPANVSPPPHFLYEDASGNRWEFGPLHHGVFIFVPGRYPWVSAQDARALAGLLLEAAEAAEQGGTPSRAVEGTPPDDPTAATEDAARSLGLTPRPLP